MTQVTQLTHLFWSCLRWRRFAHASPQALVQVSGRRRIASHEEPQRLVCASPPSGARFAAACADAAPRSRGPPRRGATPCPRGSSGGASACSASDARHQVVIGRESCGQPQQVLRRRLRILGFLEFPVPGGRDAVQFLGARGDQFLQHANFALFSRARQLGRLN